MRVILPHWKNWRRIFIKPPQWKMAEDFSRENCQTGSVWPRTNASAVPPFLLLTLWTHPSGR